MMATWVTALIAMGSNLGNRRAHLDGAVRALQSVAGVRLIAASRLYETSPVGGPNGQGPFLNAVLRAETRLGPVALLGCLHDIEAAHGRERLVRWDARTLDLDLLVHGETVSDGPDLQLPHPRLHLRHFVLAPLCDVAADLPHPYLKHSMAALFDSLVERDPMLRPVAGPAWAGLRPVSAPAEGDRP